MEKEMKRIQCIFLWILVIVIIIQYSDMKKILVSIFMVVLIVSCDYESNEHYIIDNKSKYDIHLDFVKVNSNDTTEVIVNSAATRDFYIHQTITALSKNKGDDYLDVFDTIWVSINDTLILNKDFYNMDNWDYWHKGSRDSESRFTFTISDTDLKTR